MNNEEIKNYINNVDEKWGEAYSKLLKAIDDNIPNDFELLMQYNMPTYVIPLSVFPEGYRGRSDEPISFVSLGSQKNYIALYHMGIMTDKKVLKWFQEEYSREVPTKLNMGKSCIRFTNTKNIPYDLIGQLMKKISMQDYLDNYTEYTKKN